MDWHQSLLLISSRFKNFLQNNKIFRFNMVKHCLVKSIILFWIKSHSKTFQQIYQNYFRFNSGHMLPNTISWTCRKWDKIISMVYYFFIPPVWNKLITIFPIFLSSLNVSIAYVNKPFFFYRKFLELCILNYFSCKLIINWG